METKKFKSAKKTSLKSLKKKVWREFSKYIRFKYADRNGNIRCYTCGVLINWKEAQCGHGLGGRTNLILFDEEICRPQCMRCNIFLNGNYDIFHAKLIKENGLKWFEKKLKLKHQTKQFTHQGLDALYKKYKTYGHK